MIEICCGSYADAIKAAQLGIRRIELNSALSLGGLTPSIATLQMIKRETDLSVICMVRARGAGFAYTKETYQQMYEEARMLLANGADGLAFGFLTTQGKIDTQRTLEFTRLCHQYHATAVFHRAFDCLLDLDEGIATLISCHVDRVLTSGGAKTAWEGRGMIAHLMACYGEDIELLAGCGINSGNAASLVHETHVRQVHASCTSLYEDPTTTLRVPFAIYEGAACNSYEAVDAKKILALKEALGAI